MKKGRKYSGKTRKVLIEENKKLLSLLTHYRMMLNTSYGIGNAFNRFNIQKVTSMIRVPYPVDSLEEGKLEYLQKGAETEILNNLKDYILTGSKEINNGELCIEKYIYIYKKEDEQNGRCTKM